jgi:hypothetical protein
LFGDTVSNFIGCFKTADQRVGIVAAIFELSFLLTKKKPGRYRCIFGMDVREVFFQLHTSDCRNLSAQRPLWLFCPVTFINASETILFLDDSTDAAGCIEL